MNHIIGAVVAVAGICDMIVVFADLLHGDVFTFSCHTVVKGRCHFRAFARVVNVEYVFAGFFFE